MKVLVADDEQMLRIIHRGLLRRLGVSEVEFAENGQAVVDLHASGASFDLILMDLHMPVMDGMEATRKLREMGVKSSIVGVTDLDDRRSSEKDDFLSAGLDDCVPKPLAAEHIAKYLNPPPP